MQCLSLFDPRAPSLKAKTIVLSPFVEFTQDSLVPGMADVYLLIILAFFVLSVQCIIYYLPSSPIYTLQIRGPWQRTSFSRAIAMVSRVDPDTWLSTAELFRASLPADELPCGRGGPEELARYYREAHPPAQDARVPRWLENRRLDQIKASRKKGPGRFGGPEAIDRWDAEDTQPRASPQITFGRRPVAPSVDAAAVCKRRTKDMEHRAWATYAEIRGLNAIRQYYIDHPNEFRHIPVPRVYTHSFQRPESSLVYNRLERGFIIMENIKDNRNYHRSFPHGDRGWTSRQKRRFVRKMALIRLQLLFIRNGQNGVEPPVQSRVRISVIWDKKLGK